MPVPAGPGAAVLPMVFWIVAWTTHEHLPVPPGTLAGSWRLGSKYVIWRFVMKRGVVPG